MSVSPVVSVKIKHTATSSGTRGTSFDAGELGAAATRVASAKGELRLADTPSGIEAALARLREAEADYATARASAPADVLAAARTRAETVDGLQDISAYILSFEYADEESKTDLLKLSVANQDLLFFDTVLVEKGTQLVVSWGYPGRLTPERLVVVQKAGGFTTLQIEAQDRGVLALKTTKTRVFENVRRSDVARLIAREQGFSDAEIHVDDTPSVVAAVTQAAQTDGQFLRALADKEGFEYYVDYDGMHFHPRRLGQRPLKNFVYHVDGRDRHPIMTVSLDNDALGVPGAVTLAGRDPIAKKDIAVTANASNTPRDVLAPKQEAPAATPTSTTVERVNPQTGQTTRVAVPGPVAQGDGVGSAKTSPTAAVTAADAKSQAQGAFRKAQQSVVKLSMDIVGDPDVGAKTVIQVSGIGKRLSGRYYVKTATHKISSAGYVTTLKLASDGTGLVGNATSGNQGSVAKQNTKQAPDDKPATYAVPGPVTVVERIDPRTGASTAEYRAAGGKVPT